MDNEANREEERKEDEEKKPEKWSWDVFWIKTICWRNFIWGISTGFIVWMFVRANGGIDSIVNIILAGVWGLLSVIMILHKAFEKSVGNAKINANFEASAKLNGELAEIIKSLQKGERNAH